MVTHPYHGEMSALSDDDLLAVLMSDRPFSTTNAVYVRMTKIAEELNIRLGARQAAIKARDDKVDELRNKLLAQLETIKDQESIVLELPKQWKAVREHEALTEELRNKLAKQEKALADYKGLTEDLRDRLATHEDTIIRSEALATKEASAALQAVLDGVRVLDASGMENKVLAAKVFALGHEIKTANEPSSAAGPAALNTLGVTSATSEELFRTILACRPSYAASITYQKMTACVEELKARADRQSALILEQMKNIKGHAQQIEQQVEHHTKLARHGVVNGLSNVVSPGLSLVDPRDKKSYTDGYEVGRRHKDNGLVGGDKSIREDAERAAESVVLAGALDGMSGRNRDLPDEHLKAVYDRARTLTSKDTEAIRCFERSNVMALAIAAARSVTLKVDAPTMYDDRPDMKAIYTEIKTAMTKAFQEHKGWSPVPGPRELATLTGMSDAILKREKMPFSNTEPVQQTYNSAYDRAKELLAKMADQVNPHQLTSREMALVIGAQDAIAGIKATSLPTGDEERELYAKGRKHALKALAQRENSDNLSPRELAVLLGAQDAIHGRTTEQGSGYEAGTPARALYEKGHKKASESLRVALGPWGTIVKDVQSLCFDVAAATCHGVRDASRRVKLSDTYPTAHLQSAYEHGLRAGAGLCDVLVKAACDGMSSYLNGQPFNAIYSQDGTVQRAYDQGRAVGAARMAANARYAKATPESATDTDTELDKTVRLVAQFCVAIEKGMLEDTAKLADNAKAANRIDNMGVVLGAWLARCVHAVNRDGPLPTLLQVRSSLENAQPE